MECVIPQMKSFLKSFNEHYVQSPSSEEMPVVRVANYTLDLSEIPGQVTDWILNYLDNSKSICPYPLALAIAKEAAHQISAAFAEVLTSSASGKEIEKYSSASNIYAEAISKLSAICSSFLENDAFMDRIDQDSFGSAKHATSVFSIKNKRRRMEDRHVVHHDLNALLDLKNAPPQSFYAVFDGHSGADAACYSSAQLHVNIAKHPQFLLDTQQAIIEGYRTTDLNYLNKCSKDNLRSGCTVVSALLRGNTLYLAWCGDSQAVLIKDGVPAVITDPHKPQREDERVRIESLGGHITRQGTWRVNGLLAITRAIGDPDQKPLITSEPELSTIELDGTEDFLILACDGLWDYMSPENVASVLYQYMIDCSPSDSLESVAAKLVHQSRSQGSDDNITAIVVFLRDSEIIRSNAVKFASNEPLLIQNQDFLSMNGSSAFSPSETVSKPTVLELNGTSIKKLKNAANIMSSTGFGDVSYNQNLTGSVVLESLYNQGSPVEEKNIPGACASFAPPEKTALSELPTPPIDDILASQTQDNFYATDLCKEMNLMAAEQSLSFDPSLASTHSGTDFGVNSGLNPREAIDVASGVVHNTIHDAVQCVLGETPQNLDPQSPKQLNPYAKPFVMKSFMGMESVNQPATESANPNEDLLGAGNLSSDLKNVAGNIQADAGDFVVEHPADFLVENIPLPSETKCSSVTTVEEAVAASGDQNALSLNPNESSVEIKNASAHDTIPAISPSNEAFKDTEVVSKKVNQDSNVIADVKLSSTNIGNVALSPHSPEKNPSQIDNNIVLTSEHEMMSEASTLDDITSSLSHDFENLNLRNIGVGGNLVESQSADQLSTPMLDQGTDVSFVTDVNVKEVSTPVAEESEKPESEQNVGLCITDDGNEKEKSQDPNNVLLENISKEPLTLSAITNELLAENAEMPCAEDSHVEPVAVDLKSLPENIPEAEGVTEDADSDSEKDGGWSYMKGHALSGSKTKSAEKTSKTTKSTSLKAAPLKAKKDSSKVNVDSRLGGRRSATVKSKTETELEKAKAETKTKVTMSADRVKSATTNRIKISSSTPKVGIGLSTRKVAAPSTLSAIKVSATRANVGPNGVSESSSKSAPAKPTTSTTSLRTTKPPSSLNTGVAPSKPKNVATVALKAKAGTLAENKGNTKITATSCSVAKKLNVTQSKTSTTTTTTTSSATMSSASSTFKRSTVQPKSVSAPKPKQTSVTLTRKPVTSTVRKPDVKEVKDSVNKQISAGKNASVAPGSSTLVKRNSSTAVRSTTSKMPSTNAKPTLSRRDPLKVATSQTAKRPVSQVVGKVAKASKVQTKPNEAKNHETEEKQIMKGETNEIEEKQATNKVDLEMEKQATNKVDLEMEEKQATNKVGVEMEEKQATNKVGVETEEKQATDKVGLEMEDKLAEIVQVSEKYILETNSKEIVSDQAIEIKSSESVPVEISEKLLSGEDNFLVNQSQESNL